MGLHITGVPESDAVLDKYPFAILLGMMLDQQFPMERAFAGPAKVLDRFGTLDPAAIAAAPPEEFAALFARPPVVHRYPRSMAGRVQELARHVLEEYDGDAARLWDEADSGRELFARIQALPGFGKQKSQIFVALLAKQLDVTPSRLGGGGGRLRGGGLVQVGRRRTRRRIVGEGARLQEGAEGTSEGCPVAVCRGLR